jgi:hypothetical protein
MCEKCDIKNCSKVHKCRQLQLMIEKLRKLNDEIEKDIKSAKNDIKGAVI